MCSRRTYILLFLACLVVPVLPAQVPSSQLVFSYVGIDLAGSGIISTTDTQLLDNRLKSYLLEIARSEDYSIVGLKDSDQVRIQLYTSAKAYSSWSSANRTVASQGIIALRIFQKSSYVLEATMFDPVSGETLFTTTRNYPNFEAIIEQSKEQMYALFGLTAPPASAQLQVGPFLGSASGKSTTATLSDVTGRWMGDFGMGMIEIKGDGSAIAQLQGTDSMKLKVTIQGSTITIAQDEPNSPKLYSGNFPYSIASQITKIARPMSWEFRINERKDQLNGKKNSTYVSIERGEIIQADNAYSRDAVWTRIP